MESDEIQNNYQNGGKEKIIFEKTQSKSAEDNEGREEEVGAETRMDDTRNSQRSSRDRMDTQISIKTIRPDEVDHVFDYRKTDWLSMYITVFMQFIVGLQLSVHYMSMWPYLNMMDKNAGIQFFGWVIASCSIGCTLSNPLFGCWSEKTMSIKWPTIIGFLIAAIGQLMYATSNLFSENQKWILFWARFVTGIGIGNIAALRTYAATASVPKERLQAISFGTAGFGFGFSVGPVISALFTALGPDGYSSGSFHFTMYTGPAYLMVVVCAFCCFAILVFFKESYVGIVNENDEDHVQVIVPKFDPIPAIICIYIFMMAAVIATNIEVMSTPLTTVLYNWEDQISIFYNGAAIFVSSTISVGLNIVLGTTRIGKIDKRKLMFFAIGFFMLYQIVMYPWEFYDGPLDYQVEGRKGGCPVEYEWCAETTRVPLVLFYISFVVFFGIAFPFTEAPSSVLFSEVLGPRKQGIMQGIFSFGGSIAPVIASVSATSLFENYGYKSVIILQTIILIFGAVLILAFYKRLVPLKLQIKNEEGI